MAMRASSNYYTPPVEQLLPGYTINCTQAGCTSSFTNASNFDMHLLKHHRVQPVGKRSHRFFNCPTVGCIYEVAHKHGRCFKNMKCLRQHYQKVHAAKAHNCSDCGRYFTTVGQLQSHVVRTCGRKFICADCGWEYNNREALLTHCRRKGHAAGEREGVARTLKVTKHLSIEPEVQPDSAELPQRNLNREIQTEIAQLVPTPILKTTTKAMSVHDISTELTDEMQSLLRHIETQTEFPISRCLSPCSGSPTSAQYLDQMLSQSAYTQTCDDFLSSLCLTDIQTQTNWPIVSTTTGCGAPLDELFVSTETQTSFTQCLLDRCVADDVAGDLYNTQHTQTCDTLLNELFGEQESDLIGNFQSTYTQT